MKLWIILIAAAVLAQVVSSKYNEKSYPKKATKKPKPTKAPKSLIDEFTELPPDDVEFIKELDKQFKLHGDKIKIKVERDNTTTKSSNSKRTIDGELGYGYHRGVGHGQGQSRYYFSKPKYMIYPYSQQDIPSVTNIQTKTGSIQIQPSHAFELKETHDDYETYAAVTNQHAHQLAITNQNAQQLAHQHLQSPQQFVQNYQQPAASYVPYRLPTQQVVQPQVQQQIVQQQYVEPVIVLRVPGPTKYAAHLQALLQQYLEVRAAQYIKLLEENEAQYNAQATGPSPSPQSHFHPIEQVYESVHYQNDEQAAPHPRGHYQTQLVYETSEESNEQPGPVTHHAHSHHYHQQQQHRAHQAHQAIASVAPPAHVSHVSSIAPIVSVTPVATVASIVPVSPIAPVHTGSVIYGTDSHRDVPHYNRHASTFYRTPVRPIFVPESHPSIRPAIQYSHRNPQPHAVYGIPKDNDEYASASVSTTANYANLISHSTAATPINLIVPVTHSSDVSYVSNPNYASHVSHDNYAGHISTANHASQASHAGHVSYTSHGNHAGLVSHDNLAGASHAAQLPISENYPSSAHTKVIFTGKETSDHSSTYPLTPVTPTAPVYQHRERYHYTSVAPTDHSKDYSNQESIVAITQRPRVPFNYHAHTSSGQEQGHDRKRNAPYSEDHFKRINKLINRLKRRNPSPQTQIAPQRA